jgi:hypothetical protein
MNGSEQETGQQDDGGEMAMHGQTYNNPNGKSKVHPKNNAALMAFKPSRAGS